MKAEHQDDDGMQAQLEARSAKTEATIERLLDRLEGDEAGESLMARLKAREDERDALRAEIAKITEPAILHVPTQAELKTIYRAQVERLESLLTGSDQMVAANALLKDLLGEVRVMRDPEAADGYDHAVQRGGAGFAGPQASVGQQNSALMDAVLSGLQVSVVAGTGFGLWRTKEAVPLHQP